MLIHRTLFIYVFITTLFLCFAVFTNSSFAAEYTNYCQEWKGEDVINKRYEPGQSILEYSRDNSILQLEWPNVGKN